MNDGLVVDILSTNAANPSLPMLSNLAICGSDFVNFLSNLLVNTRVFSRQLMEVLRLYVQAGVYDEFVEKLAAAAAKLKVGSGLEAGTEQGPLINMAAVEKVEQHIAVTDRVQRAPAREVLAAKRDNRVY